MVEVMMGLDAVQLGAGETRLGRTWLTMPDSRYESRRGGARIREMRMKRAATVERNRYRREPASLRGCLYTPFSSRHGFAMRFQAACDFA